jgi:hypothetical protein
MAAGHRSCSLRRPWPAVALVPDGFGCAPHKLPCRGGCRGPTPCPHRWTGMREMTGYCPGPQIVVDTGMAIDTSLATCRTSAVRRAVARAAVPEAADGQSADRSGSFTTSSALLKAARRPGSDTTVTGEPASPSSPSRTIAAGSCQPRPFTLGGPAAPAAQPPAHAAPQASPRWHEFTPSSSGDVGSRRASTTSKPCDRIRSTRP